MKSAKKKVKKFGNVSRRHKVKKDSTSSERILITAALPYVNNVPHIGNIVGSHLPADIFARFCRLAGFETVFIGGSDEHGTPIEVAAQKSGVEPKQLCDNYFAIHKKIYKWFNISYDNFSRTSLPEHHKTTQDFFLKIHKNSFIIEGVLNLPYCENCKKVLPDRYVEGKCPKCGYATARGDQCEQCSALLNPDELVEPYCVVCKSRPVFRKIKHLFLNLNKIEPALKEWIESKKKVWSRQVESLALGWIKEGLKPRCITRDTKWGVKVPLNGWEDKVFYVWFDAPIGYISSTKEWAGKIGRRDKWKKFWQGKAKIYHFIGKDNIPFHTIFWPAMLIANSEFELPYDVIGLQYLNYEGGKISKSKNWGIFCENLPESGLEPDVWRFYLSFLIPETGDSEWKWAEFRERVNNELVGNMGNFIYRTLSFIKNNFDGKVPKAKFDKNDKKMLALSQRYEKEIRNLFLEVRLRDTLKKILELSNHCNRFFQESEPWKTVKTDKKKCAATLFVSAGLCHDLAVLFYPFLPNSAEKILAALNVKKFDFSSIGKAKLSKVGEVKPLFPKIDENDIKRLKAIATKVTDYEGLFGSGDDFSKLDLRIGEIKSVENHPNTYKLLVLQVDVGEGKPRTLVARIKNFYGKEELVGKKIVVLCNLEPAVLRGVESRGMLLAAEKDEKLGVLTANNSAVGDNVFIEGADPKPAEKIAIDEFRKIQMTIDKDGFVLCRGRKLHTKSEFIKAERVGEGATIR